MHGYFERGASPQDGMQSKGSSQYGKSPSPATAFYYMDLFTSAGAADVSETFDNMDLVSVVVCLCRLRRFINTHAARIKTVPLSISSSAAVCQ